MSWFDSPLRGSLTTLRLGQNNSTFWLALSEAEGRVEVLPNVVFRRTPRHQYCQLVIKMTVRRGKGGFIYLGELTT
jgi:hypothetical protein